MRRSTKQEILIRDFMNRLSIMIYLQILDSLKTYWVYVFLRQTLFERHQLVQGNALFYH